MKKIIITLFILTVGLIGIYKVFKNSNIIIESITREQMEQMSTIDALNLLIQQDRNLTKLKWSSKRNLTTQFEIFYNNLYLFVGEDDEFRSKLWNPQYPEPEIKKIFFKENLKRYTPYCYLTKPRTKLFEMAFDCEGGFAGVINHEYLLNKYGNRLDKDWKAYLKMKNRWRKHLTLRTYYCDGYTPAHEGAISLILMEDKFIKEYPNFVLTPNIHKDRDVHIQGLFEKLDGLPYLFEEEYIDKNNKEKGTEFTNLRKNVKICYEQFLSIEDEDIRKTEQYELIKMIYNTAKNNNFKFSDAIIINLAKEYNHPFLIEYFSWAMKEKPENYIME